MYLHDSLMHFYRTTSNTVYGGAQPWFGGRTRHSDPMTPESWKGNE